MIKKTAAAALLACLLMSGVRAEDSAPLPPLKSIDEIISHVPVDVIPKMQSDWTPARMAVANKSLAELINRTATFKFPVDTVTTSAGKLAVAGRYRKPAFLVSCWTLAAKDEDSKVAKIRNGDGIEATGRLNKAVFEVAKGGVIQIQVDLADATYEKAVAYRH